MTGGPGPDPQPSSRPPWLGGPHSAAAPPTPRSRSFDVFEAKTPRRCPIAWLGDTATTASPRPVPPSTPPTPRCSAPSPRRAPSPRAPSPQQDSPVPPSQQGSPLPRARGAPSSHQGSVAPQPVAVLSSSQSAQHFQRPEVASLATQFHGPPLSLSN